MGLVTLAEVKTALGIPNDVTNRDAQITAAIDEASLAVINYTERDFGVTNVIEPRTFEYDGSGILEIDDAAAITSVSIAAGGDTYTFTTLEWEAQPHRGPIYSYLLLPKGLIGSSPEMGFKKNLDTYERNYIEPTIATVVGTWGYPTVPADVKRATIWTISSFLENPSGRTSQSIADYSYSEADRTMVAAIPQRAKELLDAYTRPI